MRLPRALVLVPLLLCAGCGPDERATTTPLPPPPLILEGMPPAVATPARPITPAGPVDETFAREREGWRVAFTLRLPALAEPMAHRIRRAAMSWLFQDYAVLPGGVTASGMAALDKLVIEHPRASGVTTAMSVERAVVCHRFGSWLSLTRTLSEPTGNGGLLVMEDALIVVVDTGSALTIDEVVPPARQSALRSALVAAMRGARKIAMDPNLPIPLPTLTANGARFVWNPSDLAEAADGAFVAELPCDAVRGLLAVDPWAK